MRVFSTHRKLIYVALLGGLFLSLVILVYLFIERGQIPISTPNSDESLAQQNERPGAALPLDESGNPLTQVAAAGAATPTLEEGCGLRFSFAPVEKLVPPGGVVHYNIVVQNRGKEVCKNTTFSVYWADGEKIITASPKARAGEYYWVVGDLPSQAEYRVTASTQFAEEGIQISNDACATADNAKGDVCGENAIFSSSDALAALPAPRTQVGSVAETGGKEYGVWIWNSPIQMKSAYSTTLLDQAKANNFNAVYITVDDYLQISQMPSGNKKQTKQNEYFAALASFVKAAQSRGIAVDIEGGARDWAQSGNRYKGYALIDMLAAYNAAYPSLKVRGFQYDVEPYLLPEYENNKAKVLTDFVQFIDESARRMKAIDATLSVVIPHFYDSTQAWTPSITINGTQGYAFTQLLRVLQQKPGSSLILMSYRNFFEGPNGTQDISAPEIQEASSGAWSTKVIVAQETGNVDPAFVTFNGLTKSVLLSEVAQIQQAFNTQSNFGGIAIHYIDPFLNLSN